MGVSTSSRNLFLKISARARNPLRIGCGSRLRDFSSMTARAIARGEAATTLEFESSYQTSRPPIDGVETTGIPHARVSHDARHTPSQDESASPTCDNEITRATSSG